MEHKTQTCLFLEHPLVVASAHMFAFPELLAIWRKHIAVFLEFAGEATFIEL